MCVCVSLGFLIFPYQCCTIDQESKPVLALALALALALVLVLALALDVALFSYLFSIFRRPILQNCTTSLRQPFF